MFDGQTEPDPEAQTRAIEALVESGLDASRMASHDRKQIAGFARVLRLIEDSAPTADPSLTDLTLLRLRRANAEAADRLGEEDADALDALVSSGFDPARVPAQLRERARRHRALADLVTRVPTPTPSADLTERTLASLTRREEPISIERHRRRRVRLSDLVSIAALLLIGASLILPVLGAVRDQQFQTVCSANMMASAMGLSTYAADNRGLLPVVTAGFGASPWWNVGDPSSSNSANLFHLAREHYVTLHELACAGNRLAPTRMADTTARDWRRLDEVSYAYRIMRGNTRAQWSAPARFVVMSDRSPVVLRAVRGVAIDPSENSPNHAGRGQQILLSDGSAFWLRTPMVTSRDNLWLPRPVEDAIRRLRGQAPPDTLSGHESPASIEDAFVGP